MHPNSDGKSGELINTRFSGFRLPERYTQESIDLKQSILDSPRDDIHKIPIIKYYIENDWNSFAYKKAVVEFFYVLTLLVLLAIAFWPGEAVKI